MQCAGGFKTVYVGNASISQKLEMTKITAERIDKQQLQVIQKILGYPPQME